MIQTMRRAVVLLATTALAVTGLLLVAPTAQAARAAQTANVPTVYVDTTGGYYRTNYAGAPVTPSSGSAAWSAVNGSGSHTIGAFTTTEVVDPLNPLNNFVDSGQGEIRGRGNYTWKTLPLLHTFSAWTQSQGGVTFSSSAVSKRPYQLKLSAGRDVLGMGSGKTWILLANHGDASLIRNKVAQDLAAEYGLPYTPQSRFVDLVVNGEYLGNYLLTEKVHEGGRRVPLKDPGAVLVEMDNNYCDTEPSALRWRSSSGNCFVLSDANNGDIPDPTVSGGSITLPAHVQAGWDAFKAKVAAFEAALNAKDWNTVQSLIDVDSFVKYYFIYEFTENPEIARSSIYFWMDASVNSKLNAGPTWDFDSSLGTYTDPTYGGNASVLYVRNIGTYRSGLMWYQDLFKMSQYTAAATTLYQTQLKLPTEESVVKVGRYTALMSASANKNFQRWRILGGRTLFPPFQNSYSSTWQGEVNKVTSFMQRRISLLNATYAPGISATASDCKTVAATAAIPAAGAFNPLDPCRMLDTRTGNGAPSGAVAANGEVSLKVTGRGGIPATGVSAVLLNVTVANPTGTGTISAYPAGANPGETTNLSFVANQVVANQVTVKVGDGGVVKLKNSAGGSVHVIADVAGFYVDGATTEAGAFQAMAPVRILDTTKAGSTFVRVPGNGTIDLPVVSAASGVPATAGSVDLNVTAVNPASDGHISVYPTGARPNPIVSNANFKNGQTVANAVTVKLGTDGKVTLENGGTGAVDLLVDVNGYFLGGTATQSGMFVPLAPARILDSRTGVGMPKGDFSAGTPRMLNNFEVVPLKVAGAGGVNATTAGAVVMNMTIANPTQVGYLTVFPTGTVRPQVSSINFTQWQDIPNLVTVKLGTGGSVNLYNMNAGQTNLVSDVAGYYIK